jgi:hypothetical protein
MYVCTVHAYFRILGFLMARSVRSPGRLHRSSDLPSLQPRRHDVDSTMAMADPRTNIQPPSVRAIDQVVPPAVFDGGTDGRLGWPVCDMHSTHTHATYFDQQRRR